MYSPSPARSPSTANQILTESSQEPFEKRSLNGKNIYWQAFLPCAPLSAAVVCITWLSMTSAAQDLRGWHQQTSAAAQKKILSLMMSATRDLRGLHLWWMRWPQQQLVLTLPPDISNDPNCLGRFPVRHQSPHDTRPVSCITLPYFLLIWTKNKPYYVDYDGFNESSWLWWQLDSEMKSFLFFGLAVFSSKETRTWCLCWNSLEHPAKKGSNQNCETRSDLRMTCIQTPWQGFWSGGKERIAQSRRPRAGCPRPPPA